MGVALPWSLRADEEQLVHSQEILFAEGAGTENIPHQETKGRNDGICYGGEFGSVRLFYSDYLRGGTREWDAQAPDNPITLSLQSAGGFLCCSSAHLGALPRWCFAEGAD